MLVGPHAVARAALNFGLALGMSACATYGLVENKPLLPSERGPRYSLTEFARKLDQRSDELTLAVAFSAGGTRAAALDPAEHAHPGLNRPWPPRRPERDAHAAAVPIRRALAADSGRSQPPPRV